MDNLSESRRESIANKWTNFKNKLKDNLPALLIDLTFGAAVLWMSWFYFLYRVNFAVFLDQQEVKWDGYPTNVINGLIAAAVAFVAKQVGGPTAELVEQTLRFISNCIATRFGADTVPIQGLFPLPQTVSNQSVGLSAQERLSSAPRKLGASNRSATVFGHRQTESFMPRSANTFSSSEGFNSRSPSHSPVDSDRSVSPAKTSEDGELPSDPSASNSHDSISPARSPTLVTEDPRAFGPAVPTSSPASIETDSSGGKASESDDESYSGSSARFGSADAAVLDKDAPTRILRRYTTRASIPGRAPFYY